MNLDCLNEWLCKKKGAFNFYCLRALVFKPAALCAAPVPALTVNALVSTVNAFVSTSVLITLLLTSLSSYKTVAQTRLVAEQPNGFELNASVEVEDVRNANRQARGQLPINEYQWRPKLAANGVLKSRISQLEIDGSYQLRRHSEQTSQNTDLFLGDATLMFGTDVSRFSAEFSYNAQELLINPLQGDAPNNLDRRNITSATAFMNLGRPQAQWTLNINRSQVTFDVSRLSNSKRQGGGINYSRGVSRVSRFGVDLSGYQLEYEQAIDAQASSFDYARAALFWSTKLKRLAYSVSAGRNTVGDQSNATSPFYDVAVTYSGDTSTFQSVLRQWITDTSQGSENTSGQTNQEPVNIDGRVDVIDQYKRTDAFVAWRYGALCQSCAIVTTLGGQQENYRQATQFDNQELYGEVRLDYKRSRYTSINAYYRYADVAFNTTNNDYSEQRVRLELSFDRLVKKGRLRFYGEYSERQNTPSAMANQKVELPIIINTAFRAHLVGVAFDYRLYKR